MLCGRVVSVDRLEVVFLEVMGDLLAEHRSLHVGGAKVDAPHTRASMISFSASEKRSKLRVVQDLLLKALKAILSVPKKFWSVCTNALVAQVCPDGCSGNGG